MLRELGKRVPELDGRQWQAVIAAGALLLCLAVAAGLHDRGGRDAAALAGEARGSMTLSLPAALEGVRVTEARRPGRPLVVIDPGHGGADPGASGVSGTIKESALTLRIAQELRARLAERGRVRVALTREDDTGVPLQTRAAIARALGADLFVSIHADSAQNPSARGATVYSLSEVASDADAARVAAAQNGDWGVAAGSDGSVRALLADLASRDAMSASADFAVRLLNNASGRVEFRPEPHRFAAFRVLRRAEAPAVLFEAGYLSNAEDEAMLRDPRRRGRMVEALAQAIETQMALNRTNR